MTESALAPFAFYPAIMLRLAEAGVITDSNGVLEQRAGRAAIGRPLREFLDDTSAAKLDKLLAARPDKPVTRELVWALHGQLQEPLVHTIAGAADGTFLLAEHPRDPKLARLTQEVSEVNSEVVNTQRELSRERARLATALLQLESRNRTLDEFAHVISHDLRTPLRTVHQLADFVAADIAAIAPPDTLEHLRMLQQKVSALQELVGGVLALARATRHESKPEIVSIDALLDDVLSLIALPASVVVERPDALPTLQTERVALQQILLNLLGNAAKYARTRIAISAHDRGEQIEFMIEDDGPGIAHADLERIWRAFEQGTAHQPGSGIGLAIVQKLVEARGGRAWAESQPGSGAAFHFTWPRTQEMSST